MSKLMIVGFLLFVGIAGLLLVGWPSGEVADDASVFVQIDGPDGEIWSGSVQAHPGTAIGALLASSGDGNFEVTMSGPIGNRYVTSIAGIGEGGGGWCIQVDSLDGQGFQDSPMSGDRLTLEDGWMVRWYWTPNQCDAF